MKKTLRNLLLRGALCSLLAAAGATTVSAADADNFVDFYNDMKMVKLGDGTQKKSVEGASIAYDFIDQIGSPDPRAGISLTSRPTAGSSRLNPISRPKTQFFEKTCKNIWWFEKCDVTLHSQSTR